MEGIRRLGEENGKGNKTKREKKTRRSPWSVRVLQRTSSPWRVGMEQASVAGGGGCQRSEMTSHLADVQVHDTICDAALEGQRDVVVILDDNVVIILVLVAET